MARITRCYPLTDVILPKDAPRTDFCRPREASEDRSAAREAARYLGCNLRFSLPELGKLRKTGERETERGGEGRVAQRITPERCSFRETTVAGHRGLSRRYNVVTKNRYSDPERERQEKVEDRGKAHPPRTDVAQRGRRRRASISVIGVRGRCLIDDPRDRNDISRDVVSRFSYLIFLFFFSFFLPFFSPPPLLAAPRRRERSSDTLANVAEVSN